MRSALAGTASKVVALKTTAAVPMSVIERMFHLLVVTANNKGRSHSVPKTQIEIYLGVQELAAAFYCRATFALRNW